MTTTCDWAACHKPAHALEDGWAHCLAHLDEHRALTQPEKPVRLVDTISADEAAALVTRRHAQQWPDTVIASELGCGTDRIKSIRQSLGLEAVGGAKRVAMCGTRSGYQRHKKDHETPCPDCTAVEREYQRIRASRRRAEARAA